MFQLFGGILIACFVGIRQNTPYIAKQLVVKCWVTLKTWPCVLLVQ